METLAQKIKRTSKLGLGPDERLAHARKVIVCSEEYLRNVWMGQPVVVDSGKAGPYDGVVVDSFAWWGSGIGCYIVVKLETGGFLTSPIKYARLTF